MESTTRRAFVAARGRPPYTHALRNRTGKLGMNAITNVVDRAKRLILDPHREWEAIDLIKKALSHHEGPFSWEGKHFTHRHVNIWPRPWQHPHPRMWSATGDPETAAEVGRRSMVHVLVLRGPEGTRRAYAAHRKARVEAGLPKVTTDNFAYAAFVYVGD